MTSTLRSAFARAFAQVLRNQGHEAEVEADGEVFTGEWPEPESFDDPPPVESYLYFIQESTTGAIKIGVAVNMRSRLNTLQTGVPARLKVLGVIPNGAHLEEAFHRVFEINRIRGEWFEPIPDLLEVIRFEAEPWP